MKIINGQNEITKYAPGNYTINASKYYKYASFFAMENISDLSLTGFKYNLENYTLCVNDSLCVSNEIIKNGEVNFTDGELLVFLSND